MKRAKGKYDPKSPRIGIHTWNLVSNSEKIEDMLNSLLKDAMDVATAEYECVANFEIEFSDDPKHDAGIIEVELPLGAEEHENPKWTFDLEELVESAIWMADDGDRPKLAAIRDKLRELANQLEVGINGELNGD